ncbi:MAG: hypothetical protein KIT11_10355 [Fimbriimonadaceae bacterium]|nr:hypothetical protein [Fimbriimonadaceae bacterium]QYK55723.1 MAG: hypothetical protein KF733_12025 [Fimbriimonadaceae bacterium]
MKLRPSYVVAAIGALALGIAVAGPRVYAAVTLAGFNPEPIKPGRVNLIAVPKEAGYRIIVSNGIAHLAEVRRDGAVGGFESPSDEKDAASAPRLPIRETLKALQGDAEALGKLTMSVNKLEDDLPPVPVTWTAEDIGKALDGDATLRAKLVGDLHTNLDGTPLKTLNLNSLLSGIVVDSPVTVNVPVEGKVQKITCRIQEPYKTLFASTVESKIMDKFNPSQAVIVGTYRDQANLVFEKIASGQKPEDVAENLRSRIEPSRLQAYAKKVEAILGHATVILSDAYMTGATYSKYDGPRKEPLSDITVQLNSEGRKRLWKYSLDHPNFQLLMTMEGVAIAAPRIKSDLSGTEVTIKRVASESLADEAVKLINDIQSGSRSK